MNQPIFQMDPTELILVIVDAQFNPNQDTSLNIYSQADLKEMTVIPLSFFVYAFDGEDHSLDTVARQMDEQYQGGGFSKNVMQVHITSKGVWKSKGDSDLNPLVLGRCNGLECYVYEYGLVALRNPETGAYKVARFD